MCSAITRFPHLKHPNETWMVSILGINKVFLSELDFFADTKREGTTTTSNRCSEFDQHEPLDTSEITCKCNQKSSPAIW